eukprot:1779755-Rhodomonas_salina.1
MPIAQVEHEDEQLIVIDPGELSHLPPPNSLSFRTASDACAQDWMKCADAACGAMTEEKKTIRCLIDQQVVIDGTGDLPLSLPPPLSVIPRCRGLVLPMLLSLCKQREERGRGGAGE